MCHSNYTECNELEILEASRDTGPEKISDPDNKTHNDQHRRHCLYLSYKRHAIDIVCSNAHTQTLNTVVLLNTSENMLDINTNDTHRDQRLVKLAQKTSVKDMPSTSLADHMIKDKNIIGQHPQ